MVKWSDRQEAIFDEYERTRNNIMISATAGAGKSSTIVECCKRTPFTKKVLFMAFNKSIAEELKTKVPDRIDVSTFHSKGLRILFSNFKFQLKINENKCFQLCKKILKFDKEDEVPFNQQTRYIFSLQEIWNQIRINLLVDYKNDIQNICLDKDFDFYDRMIQDIKDIEYHWHKNSKLIDSNKEFQMDFTDMLYLPYILLDESDFPKYDVVFIDETQDQNVLQRELTLRFIKPKFGRLISVGDEKQCQPTGTKILMADKTYKNIEDVKIGEGVACYHRNSACFLGLSSVEGGYAKGYKILDKQSRIVDEIYSIQLANGMTSSYTKEHICYARFNREKVEGCYILYLMCNDLGMWRIGVTKLYNEKANKSFGLSFRMRLEKCTKGWILDIYKSRTEALKAESIYSYKFGIPQLTFCIERSSNKSILKDQDIIDIYEQIGSIDDRVLKILNYFNKDINYPFSVNNDNVHKARNHIFLVNACNLFKEYMDMTHIDFDNWYITSSSKRYLLSYSQIEKIERKQEKQIVYCLDVEKYHNYVADGILTHNCIYQFSGSSVTNFRLLQQLPNTTTLPLDITYRCSKKIVEEAQKVFSNGIVAAPNAKEGIVRNGDFEEAQSGDFILCRNNLPLIEVFIKLLELGKKSSIKGKDFGEALCRLLEKIKYIDDLEILKEEKLQSLLDKGIPHNIAINNPSYVNLLEKCAIIMRLYSIWKDVNTLKERISKIYTDENTDDIVLSTIHKSKGLEADRVFFLNSNLIPSQYAVSQEALYSEYCLKFVAITRARNELIYCSI